MIPTRILKSTFNKVYAKLILTIKIIRANNKSIDLFTFLKFTLLKIVKLSNFFHTKFINTLK